MQEVVVVSAVRTPIGAYCGLLREVPVEKLGAIVLNEAIKRANVQPEEVDDVIMGQSFANGESPNIARLALLEGVGQLKYQVSPLIDVAVPAYNPYGLEPWQYKQ